MRFVTAIHTPAPPFFPVLFIVSHTTVSVPIDRVYAFQFYTSLVSKDEFSKNPFFFKYVNTPWEKNSLSVARDKCANTFLF